MITFLSILGVITFLVGAYFMGNFLLDTFDENLTEQIMSTLFGVLTWLAIFAIVSLCWLTYDTIRIVLCNC